MLKSGNKIADASARGSRALLWSALALAGLLAAVGWGWTIWADRSAPRLPSEAEAEELFVELHRGIYEAFDHDDEGDIYDALSASVDGDLLDRIYAEVYESLVMREQGGGVSRVRAVDVLEVRLLGEPPAATDGRPVFRVRASWEVTSSLTHEGHEHVRLSAYEGIYELARGEHGWRIVDDKILSQRRLPTLSLSGLDP